MRFSSKEEERIYRALVRNDDIHRFVDKGENISKRGPGDPTGASYAFDIYDFANGTYTYHI